MRLLLARDPGSLDREHPVIIEEMVQLNSDGKNEAVTTMIKMLADLHEHGRDSRYLVPMRLSALQELKPTSRGGIKGGSRVYLFLTEHDEAGIVNCEVKDGDSPDPHKLKQALRVIAAYRQGIPVFRRSVQP
jgi:hypothetical protein